MIKRRAFLKTAALSSASLASLNFDYSQTPRGEMVNRVGFDPLSVKKISVKVTDRWGQVFEESVNI
ncbi:MAG: hypothetical protein U5K00_07770 [Melioribacteraceae bacterium]|nr:hypothetical protein [Melioribacteraceae bacterium]